jgi:hypothetical protein
MIAPWNEGMPSCDRDCEHIPASERESEPPAELYGPPPNFAHYHARVTAVLGVAGDLFGMAMDERALRRGWEETVRDYTEPRATREGGKRSAGTAHRSRR